MNAGQSTDSVTLVSEWLDDDQSLRIPGTEWGRSLYAALRELVDARDLARCEHGMSISDLCEWVETAVNEERPLFLAQHPTFGDVALFAVAVLDDGSQVRMRNLGNRVEIRTWDETESCNPPILGIERVGNHVIDVRAAERINRDEVTGNE